MQRDGLVSHGLNDMAMVTPKAREPRMGHIDAEQQCLLRYNAQWCNDLCMRSHGHNAMMCCCTKKRAWARCGAAIATRWMQEHVALNGCNLNMHARRESVYAREPLI